MLSARLLTQSRIDTIRISRPFLHTPNSCLSAPNALHGIFSVICPSGCSSVPSCVWSSFFLCSFALTNAHRCQFQSLSHLCRLPSLLHSTTVGSRPPLGVLSFKLYVTIHSPLVLLCLLCSSDHHTLISILYLPVLTRVADRIDLRILLFYFSVTCPSVLNHKYTHV